MGGLHPLFSIWGALRTQCFKAVCQNSLLGDTTKPCVSYAVCLATLPRWHQPRVGPVTLGVGASEGNQATLLQFCLTRLHIRNFFYHHQCFLKHWLPDTRAPHEEFGAATRLFLFVCFCFEDTMAAAHGSTEKSMLPSRKRGVKVPGMPSPCKVCTQ